ncbi:MAG: Hydrogenase formation hypA family protein [Methanomassiliicoccales archaeon PtaU1.Bin124]|nr:MAG: Hydrogenase formation hypA family protein [Methanomassiliicoccales archaeon PtaU1.Bin124]
MFRFREEATAKKVLQSLESMKLHDLNIMHVCGTHQDTLVKFGIEEMLKRTGIHIRQGPGCPVCVTTTKEVVEAITLAKAGVTIAVFGDMLTVPTPIGSLADAKAEGADVRVVYSSSDAVKLAKDVDRLVFMAIGFETTSPTTAAIVLDGLPDNLSVLSCHRILPPALDALFHMGEVRIDGLIQPGHVAVILGLEPFYRFSEAFHVPQVVAGFEPLDLLVTIYMIAKQHVDGRAEVENEYSRVVRTEGNPVARRMLDDVFYPVDRNWRGFPVIPKSALELKPKWDDHNARRVYEDVLAKAPVVKEEMGNCRCGEVLRGIIESKECPAFGKACNPKRPMGPCMVSREGSCNISYRYRQD